MLVPTVGTRSSDIADETIEISLRHVLERILPESVVELAPNSLSTATTAKGSEEFSWHLLWRHFNGN